VGVRGGIEEGSHAQFPRADAQDGLEADYYRGVNWSFAAREALRGFLSRTVQMLLSCVYAKPCA
jgi:hypothetical protein